MSETEEKIERKSLARTEAYFRISYVNPNGNDGKGETITDIIETSLEWDAYKNKDTLELEGAIRGAKERKRKAKLKAKAERLLKQVEEVD